MSFVDVLIGKPLPTSDERAECIGPSRGIPIFGLDALSSAAYGPEAALTLLIALGAAGVAYIVPISLAIIILLAIVYFSYRQTIDAYPGGGGSYTVARENIGAGAGLLAAAALLIDYVLVVAVGISAGVGALVSALPSLQPHTLLICLAILVDDHHRQPARRSRSRAVLHGAHLSLPGLHGHHDCDRRGQGAVGRRSSDSGCGPPKDSCRHGGRHHLAAPQSLRERLHRHDRRGGCQQRRQGVSRTDVAERAPHADGDHRAPDCLARRHCVAGEGLPDRSHRPGIGWLPQRVVHAGGGRSRARRVLLHLHRLHPSCARALGQHRFRGSAAPVPHRRDGWLPAAFLRQSRAPPGLHGRNLCAGCAGRGPADPVRRRDRPLDSAIRRRRVPRVHFVANGHGLSLDTHRRTRLHRQHAGERTGRYRDSHHRGGGSGGQICRRRMDHHAAHPCDSGGDVRREPALPLGRAGKLPARRRFN